MEAEELAAKLATALVDGKAADVKTYDVRGKSALTDFQLVATGAAAPHLKALVTAANNAARECGASDYRTSGDPESGWIVVEFVDVIVHVFSPEARAYYALEKLWS